MLADDILRGITVARWSDLAAAWLLTYLVHSTIILAIVWAVASRRRVGNATREILWKAGLLGGLVTASVQSIVMREPMGGQLALGSRAASLMARAVRVEVREDVRDGITDRLIVARQAAAPWTSGLVALWLTTAGLALLWLTTSHARASGWLHDRESLEGTPAARRLRGLLARTGPGRRVALSCSARIASPLALVGDEICLPRRALEELEPAEQDGMLAHELAHLVRRDPHWLVVARVIETVLFFQPLNRLARHRMQEAAEFLCDDWAVERTREPVVLARCLATVAEWVGRAPRLEPVSAMVEVQGSPLVRRVGRILRPDVDRRARAPHGALGACALALAAFAAAVPRVTVGDAMFAKPRVMVVSELVAGDRAAERRGALLMRHVSESRTAADSLVARFIVVKQGTPR